MSLKRQIRDLVVAGIKSAQTAAQSRVFVPRDWPTMSPLYPCVLVRAPSDSKESVGRTLPEFTTTVTIEVIGRVEASAPELAEGALEDLSDQLELAVLTYEPLIQVTQQFTRVTSDEQVTAQGEMHLGEVIYRFEIESFEFFDPTVSEPSRVDPTSGAPLPATAIPLNEVDIHVDLQNIYDPTGTYPNPPFPGSVTPAPRTEGPDGRDEGYLDFPNLQA